MKNNKVSIYLLFMDLLVAFKNDPAGHNMAKFISQDMNEDGNLFRGKNFDLVEIDSPTISADWLDEKYDYDGFIFLSKHAAESGTLALTCHSTGNFNEAKFGGNQKELSIPYPDLQKKYMQKLWANHESFSNFERSPTPGEKQYFIPFKSLGTIYPASFSPPILIFSTESFLG